jgi:hypothetical protein
LWVLNTSQMIPQSAKAIGQDREDTNPALDMKEL